MKPPLFVRPLSAAEKGELEAGLRSRDGFTLRRSQILLASARGHRASEIVPFVGCSTGTVRNTLLVFQREGSGCLGAKGTGPKNPPRAWPRARDDELRELLHQTPRTFGKPRTLWTLELLAEVCFERGMTERQLSAQTFSSILARLGINWKRARDWMTSPDPEYAAKEGRRDALLRASADHPEWAVGFEDEVWWSRVAQPKVRAWTGGPPLKVQVLTSEAGDPDPDAIACYGFYRYDTRKVTVRFVEGRPVGEVTIQFLGHPFSARCRACEPGTLASRYSDGWRPATMPVVLLMLRAFRRPARWGDWVEKRFRTFRLVTSRARSGSFADPVGTADADADFSAGFRFHSTKRSP